jgi:SPP1 gp7 family putative phage head morphogenesis protein
MEIVPHAEAAALIRDKPIVTREAFDQLLPELRARTFLITGVESATVLQRVRDEVASLPEGKTWDDAKQSIADSLEPFLGDQAENRATLLLRTHGFQAFQASNWRVAQEDEDTTHLQYLATEDDRVRDSHLALNGIILPKNDPFWDDHFPPWEWNCRCRVRPMNVDMVQEAKDEDTKRNPEDKLVLEGPAAKKLNEGTLLRDGRAYDVSPPEKEKFHFHPDDLRIPIADLKSRYDTDVWDTFQKWAQTENIEKNLTVWDWLKGSQPTPAPKTTPPAKPTPAPKPTPPPVQPPNAAQQKLKTLKFKKPIVDAAGQLRGDAIALTNNLDFAASRKAYYIPEHKRIFLGKDPTSWHGHPMTFFHETGHHLHFQTGIIDRVTIRADFKAAMQKDFAAWQTLADKEHGANWKALFDRKNIFPSLEAFRKQIGAKTIDSNVDIVESKRVSRVADTVSGLSLGKYGTGHKYSYMSSGTHGAMEVFAHAFSSIMDGDVAFQQLFPNVVDVVKNALNL